MNTIRPQEHNGLESRDPDRPITVERVSNGSASQLNSDLQERRKHKWVVAVILLLVYHGVGLVLGLIPRWRQRYQASQRHESIDRPERIRGVAENSTRG